MSEQKEHGREIIRLDNIIKRFYIGQPNELEILHGINLSIYEGEFTSIIGASGSGKSTLMNIIGALDKPTLGSYTLDGVDIVKAPDSELSGIRNRKIGFVFQTYNLISRTSALKNVEMPMLYKGVGGRERRERAMELLEMVGMKERMSHTPDELSGGQKQRVAIARAMACDPAIILADEPTGALDTATGRQVMDIFHELNEKQGKTIVLITHAPNLAEETARIITLSDGRIINERRKDGRVIDHEQTDGAPVINLGSIPEEPAEEQVIDLTAEKPAADPKTEQPAAEPKDGKSPADPKAEKPAEQDSLEKALENAVDEIVKEDGK